MIHDALCLDDISHRGIPHVGSKAAHLRRTAGLSCQQIRVPPITLAVDCIVFRRSRPFPANRAASTHENAKRSL